MFCGYAIQYTFAIIMSLWIFNVILLTTDLHCKTLIILLLYCVFFFYLLKLDGVWI